MADKPESGDGAKPKTDNGGAANAKADPPAAPAGQEISVPITGHMPPIPPGSMPQLAGAMLGITVGQPQQNPAVVEQICKYLSHDSDNRLRWFEERGKKSHVFRMTALLVVAILSVIVLAIPLVALAGRYAFRKGILGPLSHANHFGRAGPSWRRKAFRPLEVTLVAFAP